MDGMTSKEMFLKLLNTSRGSLRELREDYEDYLRVHGLQIWDKQHPRYMRMVQYCYHNHELEDYRCYFERLSEEEFCNLALTLCHQSDRGIVKYMAKVEKEFLESGGIREQMSQARRGKRGF